MFKRDDSREFTRVESAALRMIEDDAIDPWQVRDRLQAHNVDKDIVQVRNALDILESEGIIEIVDHNDKGDPIYSMVGK